MRKGLKKEQEMKLKEDRSRKDLGGWRWVGGKKRYGMEEARERKRERTVWRDGMDRSIVVGGRGGQRRQDKKDRR